MKSAKNEYLDKASKLSETETERVLSRMGGKLPKKLDKEKLSQLEALAIQLELEDEQLNEWRERMYSMKSKEKS